MVQLNKHMNTKSIAIIACILVLTIGVFVFLFREKLERTTVSQTSSPPAHQQSAPAKSVESTPPSPTQYPAPSQTPSPQTVPSDVYQLVIPDPASYDQQLVKVDPKTGEKKVLVPSIKNAFPELKTDFNKTLSKLSFPAQSDKLFFQEIFSETDAGPVGLVAYDIPSNKFTRLKVSQFWKYEFEPKISPDGRNLVATYDFSSDGRLRKLYVLNLETDTATLLVTLKGSETLNSCAEDCLGISDDLSWIDNQTIQYSVYDVTKKVSATGEYQLVEKRKVDYSS